MIREDEVYRIGTLIRTHGIHGEVSMSFTDDVWDRTDAEYLVLRTDGILVPFFIEEYRFRSDTTALIKFEGYDTPGQARELCGCDVYFPFSLTEDEPGDERELTWRYFTGYRLRDSNGILIGTIDQVDDRTSNVLFCVGRHLIPAASELVCHIDTKEREIAMRLPEGLLALPDDKRHER